MKKIYSIFIITLGALLVMLSLSGCQDNFMDRFAIDSDDGDNVDKDGKVTMTIRYETPGLSVSPPTRSTQIGISQESALNKENTRLMIFGSDGGYIEDAKIVEINRDSYIEQNGKIQFTATPGVDLNFVIIANSSVAKGKTINVGATKVEVLKDIMFTVDGSNTDFSATGIPMWGEVPGVTINDEDHSESNPIMYLLRAVARVDVGLNMTFPDPHNPLRDEDFESRSQELTSIIVDPATKKEKKVTWTLNEVKFYNATQNGLVVPKKENLEFFTDTNVKNRPRAKAPSLPTKEENGEIVSNAGNQDLTYEATDNIVKRIIYVPEVDNPEASDEVNADYVKDRPYLILNLSYRSEDGSVNGESFFRVDFIKKEGDTYKYMPLLRNYRYKVDIRDIGDLGYDKEEDAKKAPAANIDYVVTQWEESMMSNVQYDGQYMLAVSQDTITFDGAGGTYDIKVQTSWTKGFEIKSYEVEEENASSWVSTDIKPTDPEKTGETDEKTVTFTVDSKDDADRSGKMVIQAGRMKWIVNVIQKKEINYEIGIYEDEECKIPLSFVEINEYGEAYDEKNPAKSIHTKGGEVLTPEQAVAYKYFYVKSKPQNAEVFMVTPDNPENPFKVTLEETLSGGVRKYKVTARDITGDIKTGDIPFETFDATYMFAFENNVSPEDDVDSKERQIARISFLQKEYDALPYSDPQLMELLLEGAGGDNVYLMDGNRHAFYVKANTPYKVELVSLVSDYGEKKGIEDFIGPSEVHNPSLNGRTYEFKTAEDLTNPTIYHAVATFKVTSPYGFFPERKFDIELVSAIKQPEANTYMIKAGAKQGILIPVSRVNTAKKYYDILLSNDIHETRDKYKLPGLLSDFQLNSLDADDDYKVEVLWTDIHDINSAEKVINPEKKKIVLSGLKDLGISKDRDLDAKVESGAEDNDLGYIYVRAGDIPGNVLITLRSDKISRQPVLWSWHIWIVEDYPTVEDLGNNVKIMSRLLGALKDPYRNSLLDNNLNDINTFGMQYQWGRKDPFPATGVYKSVTFYDGDGDEMDFHLLSRGQRSDRGLEIAREAAGVSLTMKGSIENPEMLISHQSFWQYELFPHSNVDYFNKKWTFLYPWNDVTKAVKSGVLSPDNYGGKTVFDPSPYGFCIMSQSQSQNDVFNAYNKKFIYTPWPGTIYDGLYDHGSSGSNACIYAVAQGRTKFHAGSYLINTAGWTSGSYNNGTYRRCNGFSVRPVVDNAVTEDYTIYWPDYEKK